jgi:hypothetical protein
MEHYAELCKINIESMAVFSPILEEMNNGFVCDASAGGKFSQVCKVLQNYSVCPGNILIPFTSKIQRRNISSSPEEKALSTPEHQLVPYGLSLSLSHECVAMCDDAVFEFCMRKHFHKRM